ncbi:MAG TPA: CpsB/CapC family capsule biosynthesis tyrosine phosphatase [Solirubrobacteraceae bacterium]|nr:CpsB/CapC family capsule biosynthesis tyrosine phosphatase [Solirubrobacteraceae bacterium]
MIDVHCHILPELDDGARSLEDSVAMARQAREDGIAVVCATPHIRHDHDVHIGELASRVKALQRELVRRKIDVQVLPGGEVAQSAVDGLDGEELRDVWLGGANISAAAQDSAGAKAAGSAEGSGEGAARGERWLLLEPAPGPLDETLDACVERLARRETRAIVAHPERHAGADFERRLEGLVERGCLIQWTAEFVAGAQAGDLVLDLAGRGLVHLLGSDAHSSLAGRPVKLSDGFARLQAVCSRERLAWMAEQAPRAIVRGEPLMPAPA